MMRVVASIFMSALFAAGLLCFATPAVAQTMSLREIKYNYRKARKAEKRQQYEKASRLYFDIVENGSESPRYQRRARYRLAFTLFRQKLHIVALDYVVQILRNTGIKSRSSLFVRATNALVRIAQVVNDETLVIKMISRVPRYKQKLAVDKDPVDFLLKPRNKFKRRRWWPRLRVNFAFLMGRYYFLKGRRGFTNSRRFLNLIKRGNAPSDIYAKSLYLRAVMNSWTGKYKRALARFKQILPLKLDPKSKAYSLMLKVREQAQYGIARTRYATGRIAQIQHLNNPKRFKKSRYMGVYRKALIGYNNLPKQRGIFQAQVLFETAYTYFMMEQYHFSLGKLLALQSPYYRTGFFPELQILRALIYFKTCKYEDTKATVENFRKQYIPLQKKLTVLLSYRKARKWRQQYYGYYLKQLALMKRNAKTDIPASIISSVGKEKSLQNFEALLRKVNSELQAIRAKSSSWRESNIGKRLLSRAVNLQGALRRQAGNGIYVALRYLRNQIASQINQSRIIQLETLQNQKKELLLYAQGGGIEQDEFRYTIVTEQSHIFWPYQGEYWRDEVGYYRQFIQGECKQ